MRIAITGATYLTPQEQSTVWFILDGIFCQHSHGTPVLITGGRKGVEHIAKKLATKWYWASTVIHKETSSLKRIFKTRALDVAIAKDCDLLISIQHGLEPSYVAAKADKLGKRVMEIYV